MHNLWKSMIHNLGVKLAIVFLLALGTGGIMAVFNPVYTLILAELPFPQSDRLVVIGGNIPLYNTYLNRLEKNIALDYLFSNMTSYVPIQTTSIIMSGMGKYRAVRALEVTEDFFNTLGVHPLYGYDFLHYKDGNSVVISNRFWRNELDHTDSAVGEPVQINNIQGVIAGIMPDVFDFPGGIDIWFCDRTPGMQISSERQFLGRLRSGISMEQARRTLKTIKVESSDSRGVLFGKDGPVLQPLKNILYGDRQHLLLSLSIAAILFLLLVCSGVMSIIVTQGTRRKSEITMRLILGASRQNIVSKLIKEMLPLIVVGTMAGVWLSRVAGVWLRTQFPILQSGEIITPVKITFFVTLVIVVAIISCLAPAVYTSRVNLNMHLKSGMTLTHRFFSMQELLSGIQLSLALALLIGAGLLLHSLLFKVDFPVGWSNREIAVVMVKFPLETSPYSNDALTRRANFSLEFRHRLGAMAEVITVGILNPIPFSDDAERASQIPKPIYKNREAGMWLDSPSEVARSYIKGSASPEGFNILGIPLVAGRFFNSKDVVDELEFRRRFLTAPSGKDAAGVVIINQSLAKQFWPNENAVGKIIYDTFMDSHEIVGVVQDFYQTADNKQFIPAMYSPAETSGVDQKFLVRLRSNTFMSTFRQRLLKLNTGSAYIEVQSLKQNVAESTAHIHLALQLLGCFALLGIIVAGLGVYAITTLMMVSRNRETGIRMALGAQSIDILRFAILRGMRPVLIGLPVGLILAWILAKMLSSFIFQVNASVSLAWTVSCVLLIGIVIVAVLIPALRAIRVNPINAMRNE
jgi:predicted permease